VDPDQSRRSRTERFRQMATAAEVSWEFDGRLGDVRFNKVRRSGMAFMRDAERGLVAFHTLPLGISPDLSADEPPRSEQYIVSADEFIST
jgi:hypothetical protein